MSRDETTCCVAGGELAEMMLALLLARRGVPVPLLEARPLLPEARPASASPPGGGH